MNADQPPSSRNGLGAVTFVIAVLGALLAVIPATAAFGALLCFVAIIPAIVSFRRVRRGTATNRRRCVTALVLAPVFFVVAICIGAATAPPPTNPASTPALQQSPAAIASSPAAAPAQAPPAAASAPVAASAAVKAPVAAVPASARAPVAVPAPARSPAHAVAPPPPQAASVAGSSCDESTHYVNSDGACVPRPAAAATPPRSATAKCVDGEFSFSKHPKGTCSGHGGVAQWL